MPASRSFFSSFRPFAPSYWPCLALLCVALPFSRDSVLCSAGLSLSLSLSPSAANVKEPTTTKNMLNWLSIASSEEMLQRFRRWKMTKTNQSPIIGERGEKGEREHSKQKQKEEGEERRKAEASGR